MNDLFSAYFNSEYEGTVKINKTEFVGKKITITNSNKVVVDGQPMDDVLIPPIYVSIIGNVQQINGPVASIIIEGLVDKVNTVSGEVRCGNVSGNVKTVSGDILCSAIGGTVSTVSGNVQVFGMPVCPGGK